MIAKTAQRSDVEAPPSSREGEDALPRRPVSGTMARVAPQAPDEAPEPAPTLHDLSAFDDADDDAEIFGEEPTCVSSPLKLLDTSDEEMTREYRDLPTRVMHSDEGAPPSSQPVSQPVSQPASQPTPAPPSGVQAVASVVVAEEIAAPRKERTPDPLDVDRALLRALTAPRFAVPPVVAIRPAPPSPRMLAIVAGFTALGMLWVMAVCAMVLVLLTR